MTSKADTPKTAQKEVESKLKVASRTCMKEHLGAPLFIDELERDYVCLEVTIYFRVT